MTVAAGRRPRPAAARGPGVRAVGVEARRFLDRHPEWPVLLAAAAAWAALLGARSPTPGSGARGPVPVSAHHASPGVQGGGWSSAWLDPASVATGWADGVHGFVPGVAAGWGHWALMVVAMMLPGLVPSVRHAAFASPRRRRHGTTALFVAAYLALWIVVGLGVTLVVGLLRPGVMAAAAVLVAASAWELTPVVRRALARCHRSVPLGVEGRTADVAALRFGWFHARACAATCAPFMVAATFAGHPLWLALGIATVTCLQKLGADAERWVHPVAVLGVLSAVVLVGTS